MANSISKIKIPSGTVYEVKDDTSRGGITDLRSKIDNLNSVVGASIERREGSATSQYGGTVTILSGIRLKSNGAYKMTVTLDQSVSDQPVVVELKKPDGTVYQSVTIPVGETTTEPTMFMYIGNTDLENCYVTFRNPSGLVNRLACTVVIDTATAKPVDNISKKLDKPSTEGTAGQVVASDGNGGTEWVNMVEVSAEAAQLPEGSSPTVTSELVSGVPTLTFGIPTGATGATGAKGNRGDTVIIAKDYADLTFPVYAGKTYCYYDNKPYVANTDIATTEAWTAAHWDEVSFEDEIGTLESTINSEIAVFENDIEKAPTEKITDETSDLDISDEQGNVLVRFTDGHIKTKEFDSEDIKTSELNNDAQFQTDEDLDDAIDHVNDTIEQTKYDIASLPENSQGSGESDLDISDEQGNVITRFAGGHIKTKKFDSSNIKSSDLNNDADFVDKTTVDQEILDVKYDAVKKAECRVSSDNTDFDIVDESGNVLVQFAGGHIKTKKFDSENIDFEGDFVKTVNNTYPDQDGNINVYSQIDPEDVYDAVSDYLDQHPVAASAAGIVSVSDYGAVGDGETDDSQAIQDAVNNADDIYFESGKTYYLASPVTINKSIKLHGGNGTVIKTKTPSGGTVNDGIRILGTLKKSTTLTTDYYSTGSTSLDNCSNRLTLADMTNVEIGDLVRVQVTDTNQRYSYSRRYYYLGGIFKVVDKYDGHIYINRNMPFDIMLNDKVKVYVYDAPVAVVENLNFESDLGSFGTSTYSALLQFQYCKDSVIRNCNLNNMKIGFRIHYCVNTLIDGVQVSKSRWVNESGLGDGYGIVINSSTNTVVQRVVSLCAQGCIDMGGYEPCFDTFIYNSQLGSECRGIGLDMHDNSYNLVVEDCVMGGMSVFGTAKINRCKFIKNNRPGTDGGAISFRGSHDPRWSQLYVSNCEFDDGLTNWMTAQAPQDWVRPIDSIIGRVVFEHCHGGSLQYTPTTGEYILSNTFNYLEINDWQDCNEFYHDSDQLIKKLVVKDCTFIEPAKINKHTGVFSTDGIETTVIKSTEPYHNRLLIGADIIGGRYILPGNVPMNVSSTDDTALYIVCGENCASNNPADWHVGSVSGSSGNPISKAPNTEIEPYLTVDSNGKLVFTQPTGNTSNYAIFPKCMMQAREDSVIRISVKLKNTGNTSGQGYRAYIAIVDPDTGYVTYRNNGTYQTATADGALISHNRFVPKGYIAMAYVGGYDAVSDSETTFDEFKITITPNTEPAPAYSEYAGDRRTGDGTLLSKAGINQIMSSSDSFHLSFDAAMERGLY